jgi:hypothetical protein
LHTYVTLKGSEAKALLNLLSEKTKDSNYYEFIDKNIHQALDNLEKGAI